MRPPLRLRISLMGYLALPKWSIPEAGMRHHEVARAHDAIVEQHYVQVERS